MWSNRAQLHESVELQVGIRRVNCGVFGVEYS